MHEYKVVPAPVRAPKVRGLKTTAERFSHALTEAINAEAAGGWQFLRTETLPCEERGTLGRTRTSTQVVMVFGRPLGMARPDAGAALAAAQEHYSPPEAPRPAPESAPARREPLFRAGTLLRNEAAPQRTEPVLRPRPPADPGSAS